mgnify:FL=1
MSEIRWKQRFQNFENAFLLLKQAFEKDIKNFSDLEKEGVIQRFEYTFELAWKTLKDYLESQGVRIEQITPKMVIKHAFASKIITNGQQWIDMLEDRNLMSHEYEQKVFEKVFHNIQSQYVHVLEDLYETLKQA